MNGPNAAIPVVAIFRRQMKLDVAMELVKTSVWHFIVLFILVINWHICINQSPILLAENCVKHLLWLSVVWPSVLWRCWLGGRKGIRPVKNWAVGFWRGYLSGARCRLAYGPTDASVKSRLVLPFGYRLSQVVPEKGLLNGCICSNSCLKWHFFSKP